MVDRTDTDRRAGRRGRHGVVSRVEVAAAGHLLPLITADSLAERTRGFTRRRRRRRRAASICLEARAAVRIAAGTRAREHDLGDQRRTSEHETPPAGVRGGHSHFSLGKSRRKPRHRQGRQAGATTLDRVRAPGVRCASIHRLPAADRIGIARIPMVAGSSGSDRPGDFRHASHRRRGASGDGRIRPGCRDVTGSCIPRSVTTPRP